MKRRAVAGGLNRYYSSSGGYTVIELMIVLTVTIGLFVGVAAVFSGKQARTEAEQAVRDFESSLQTITTDVSNGFFPNGITCSASTSPVTISPPATSSGSNTGCIFLGKIVSFRTNSLDILSVVGNQFTGGVGTSTTNDLSVALPVVVEIKPQSYNFRFGLTPVMITDISDPNIKFGSLAFLTQLGDGSGASDPLSGSQSTLLYGVSGTGIDQDITTVAGKIKTSYKSLVRLPQGARICLKGGNGKAAEVTIGEGGGQITTKVLIDTGVSSVCA